MGGGVKTGQGCKGGGGRRTSVPTGERGIKVHAQQVWPGGRCHQGEYGTGAAGKLPPGSSRRRLLRVALGVAILEAKRNAIGTDIWVTACLAVCGAASGRALASCLGLAQQLAPQLLLARWGPAGSAIPGDAARDALGALGPGAPRGDACIVALFAPLVGRLTGSGPAGQGK